MDVSEFDFELPPELIAQEPPPERTDARLLVLSRATGAIEHGAFANLSRYSRPGDLLVVNDTRVYPARLLGRRVPSGGQVECLLLAREEPGSRESESEGRFQALVHPGQKLKPGARLAFEGAGARIEGEILARHFHGRRTVRLRTPEGSLDEAIDRIGHVPLPPYIKRTDEPSDRERYQTVYASARGSVAAPTAGLHFSRELLASLDAKGVERISVTLHVGYGTFKPVRAARVEDHVVDAENFIVTQAAADALTRARRERRRIVAVGTTTVRALESLMIDGGGHVQAARGSTTLFVRPGHQFRLVDALITNFHLPRSSLLMLVAAFGGRETVLGAYREAVERGYRFYSYGDGMLVE